MQENNSSKSKKTILKTGNTYFLGIGINTYKDFTPLNNAVKDVKDIGQLLTTTFGFSKKAPFYKLLVNKNATRRNIIRQLNQLAKSVEPIDRVLIYYSGHGYLDEQTNLGYWIPVDAEQEFIGDYVTNSDVRDIIKAMNCRHILLISDSCFSGSLLTRAVVKRVANNRAFYDWERKASRWVVSSGKGVVPDGAKGENSPFAKQLLQHLAEAKQQININDLANKVTTSIQYNYEQQPEASPLFGAGHEGGQFIFYKNGVLPNFVAASSTASVQRSATDSNETEVATKSANPPKKNAKKMPTNLTELKKYLKDLVAEGESKKALDLFKQHLQKDASIENELIQLTARYNRNDKDVKRSLVSNDNAKMELARINYALTSYIDDLEEEDVQFPPIEVSATETVTRSVSTLSALEQEGLDMQAQLLQKKINRIRKALILETDASREFAYEEQVADLEAQLGEIKKKLS